MQAKCEDRLINSIPLIQDTTEFITPEKARLYLEKNKNNRPVNWPKVEEYKKLMLADKWKLHPQGIIFDDKDFLLTGQKRLWAIIYSGKGQYMRVSRGTPTATETLIDRGMAQTNRDLASRKTERKHSPIEASLCRARLALEGNTKPSIDQMAQELIEHSDALEKIIEACRRVKKNKEHYMILGAMLHARDLGNLGKVDIMAKILVKRLEPTEVAKCWNKGAVFTLAMKTALEIVYQEGRG